MAIDLFLGKTRRDWSRESGLSKTSQVSQLRAVSLVKTALDTGFRIKPSGRGVILSKRWKF